MTKYLVIKDNKVISEITRNKALTSKERTHLMYEMNQQYPESIVVLAKVSMEVYTPLFQVQR